MPEASITHRLPTLDFMAQKPAIKAEQLRDGIAMITGHCHHGSTTVTLEPRKDEGPVDLSADWIGNRIRKDHRAKFGCLCLRGEPVNDVRRR